MLKTAFFTALSTFLLLSTSHLQAQIPSVDNNEIIKELTFFGIGLNDENRITSQDLDKLLSEIDNSQEIPYEKKITIRTQLFKAYSQRDNPIVVDESIRQAIAAVKDSIIEQNPAVLTNTGARPAWLQTPPPLSGANIPNTLFPTNFGFSYSDPSMICNVFSISQQLLAINYKDLNLQLKNRFKNKSLDELGKLIIHQRAFDMSMFAGLSSVSSVGVAYLAHKASQAIGGAAGTGKLTAGIMTPVTGAALGSLYLMYIDICNYAQQNAKMIFQLVDLYDTGTFYGNDEKYWFAVSVVISSLGYKAATKFLLERPQTMTVGALGRNLASVFGGRIQLAFTGIFERIVDPSKVSVSTNKQLSLVASTLRNQDLDNSAKAAIIETLRRVSETDRSLSQASQMKLAEISNTLKTINSSDLTDTVKSNLVASIGNILVDRPGPGIGRPPIPNPGTNQPSIPGQPNNPTNPALPGPPTKPGVPNLPFPQLPPPGGFFGGGQLQPVEITLPAISPVDAIVGVSSNMLLTYLSMRGVGYAAHAYIKHERENVYALPMNMRYTQEAVFKTLVFAAVNSQPKPPLPSTPGAVPVVAVEKPEQRQFINSLFDKYYLDKKGSLYKNVQTEMNGYNTGISQDVFKVFTVELADSVPGKMAIMKTVLDLLYIDGEFQFQDREVIEYVRQQILGFQDRIYVDHIMRMQLDIENSK